MNKTQLLWGIICLVVAAVLAVLNLTLPPEDLMFQVGDKNMSWLPPVVLGIMGIILVATANKGEEAPIEASATHIKGDPEKIALNKRLETISFGLFLVMLGGFQLVPKDKVPAGWWAIGVGLIFLGLNAMRYFSQIRMSGFTTFLGLLSIVGGIAQLLGWEAMEGAFLFIIIGAALILKPWFDKRQMFGKAEES